MEESSHEAIRGISIRSSYHMPNEARENNLGRSTDMPCDHNCWLFCLSQWPGLNEPMIWHVAFLANPSKAGISVEARSDTRLIALPAHSWFCYSITRCWALDCGPYPNHPGLESRGAKCSCVLSMRTYIYIYRYIYIYIYIHVSIFRMTP